MRLRDGDAIQVGSSTMQFHTGTLGPGGPKVDKLAPTDAAQAGLRMDEAAEAGDDMSTVYTDAPAAPAEQAAYTAPPVPQVRQVPKSLDLPSFRGDLWDLLPSVCPRVPRHLSAAIRTAHLSGALQHTAQVSSLLFFTLPVTAFYFLPTALNFQSCLKRACLQREEWTSPQARQTAVPVWSDMPNRDIHSIATL